MSGCTTESNPRQSTQRCPGPKSSSCLPAFPLVKLQFPGPWSSVPLHAQVLLLLLILLLLLLLFPLLFLLPSLLNKCAPISFDIRGQWPRDESAGKRERTELSCILASTSSGWLSSARNQVESETRGPPSVCSFDVASPSIPTPTPSQNPTRLRLFSVLLLFFFFAGWAYSSRTRDTGYGPRATGYGIQDTEHGIHTTEEPAKARESARRMDTHGWIDKT